MKEKYLSLIEIAEDLNLTTRAVMGLIRKNELPAYQFGRGLRDRQNHFHAFVEKSKIKEG